MYILVWEVETIQSRKQNVMKLMNSVCRCRGGGKSPYVSLFLAKWHPTLSFHLPPSFLEPPSFLAHQSKFSERSFSTAALTPPTMKRALLGLSLPLRHFRSFSLIRAPFWPAGGSMPSYVPCINIGQRTYLKKGMSKNEISRDFTYTLLVLLLLLSMQLLIM